MRRQLGLSTILLLGIVIPLVFSSTATASGLANAGSISEFDSSATGWWQTYDGLTVIANETGDVTAYDLADDGTITQVWTVSLNTSISGGDIDNNQHRLAIYTDSGVSVISTELHSELYSLPISNGVDAIAWGSQGELWVSDRIYKFAMKFENTLDTGITTQSHSVKLSAILGLPDGRVVTGGRDLIVQISAANGTHETDLMDIESEVAGLYLIDDDATLLVVSVTGQLVTYSTTNWQKTGDAYLSNGGIIRSVIEVENGNLIVGAHNGYLSILNGTSLSEEETFSSLGDVVGIKSGLNNSFFLLVSFSDRADILMFDVDNDGDGIVDLLDSFPNDSTQQTDADGDGYGDNPQGNNADRFPQDPSQWVDSDGDGKGDNAGGTNGDAFPNNEDQYLDSDGDGYGDNTLGIDGDAFPTDSTQWKDTDGDGLGDNPNGTSPDDCINSPGNSYKDREGCPDSDRDGYSNPSQGEVPCSAANPNGPDTYPQDATQWCDTDQDNYGDNLNGNNPDWCPAEWGNSTRGIMFDFVENKYVTIQRFGCIDSDGDGYEDSGERTENPHQDWSTNKSEWVDSDRDGVGDNADWDDLDPSVWTLEQYCIKNSDDYNNCEVEYVPDVSTDDSSDLSSSEKRNKLIKEFIIYGGGIGIGLIAGIVAMWGLIGLIRTSLSKRATDAQYTHQDATQELQAWEEGEKFESRGGITEEKGWEGEKLGDGVTEDQLWDISEDVSKPSAIPDSSMFTEDGGVSADAVSEELDYHSMTVAQLKEQLKAAGLPVSGKKAELIERLTDKPSTTAPEPEPVPVEDQPTPPPASTELPAGAPPLPDGGLPMGWTMEQWVYYGHQWWEAQNKE
ncbi:MAG TPA: hypothetical protein HA340_06950 [Candidatus Thalassarchaeaceae archaeon]|jgi:hypothetical protein|nr:SAP domain-containing protein [Candidatus Thalassarchaeaceae archaeon]DAC48438.1 MAG TPA: hypothetical protein D7H97_06920 [Candidatus Poseidoniales archaeon]HIH83667.1 hypothetical protein [Candidatus Thalassarchaeaceae archaeon]|tara:strand:- start:2108 stop:4648 length:2541 start_codon:yes stop_codon:yes gene_type:complete